MVKGVRMANNIELLSQLALRADSSTGWNSENPVLIKGEPGFDTTVGKLKIGDGTTAWKALPFIGGTETNHYEATGTDAGDIADITTAVGAAELHDGDTAVVKHTIAGDKLSYTAYVYENGAWKAMDGNYSADNVYFSSDFTYTAAIGAVPAPSGGSGTLTASGQSLSEFMTGILAKEQEPSIVQPSATIALNSPNSTQYVAVGSTGTLQTKTTFKAGSYTYGYIATSDGLLKSGTGVSVTDSDYSVSDSSSSVAPEITTTGALSSVVWTPTDERQSCKVKGAVSYTGTPGKPATNLKKASTTKSPIASGTATTTAVEPFRSYIPAYYGFKYPGALHATPAAISAADAKALGGTVSGSTAYNRTKPTSFTATKTWQQFFVAIPTTWSPTTPTAKDSNNLALTIVKGGSVTIKHGTKDYTYNTYYINLAAGYDTKQISLSW